MAETSRFLREGEGKNFILSFPLVDGHSLLPQDRTLWKKAFTYSGLLLIFFVILQATQETGRREGEGGVARWPLQVRITGANCEGLPHA